MKDIIQQARKKADKTQEEAARAMFLSLRQYQNLEYGDRKMTPEEALRLGKILDCPQLTIVYCRQECAIGNAYCYEVLNNVDLSPVAILTKYRQESSEASEALKHLAEIMLNKRDKDDCTEAELAEIRRWFHEMLDLEHVIETLKLRLWDFLDVAGLVREHNRKCLERRYVDIKKPELELMAG